MPYLIDSDVVIDHLADVAAATKLLDQLASDGIAVSIITYMEAYQGVLRSPHPAIARKQLKHFWKLFRCFRFLKPVPSVALSCEKPCTERASASKREHLI